MTNLFLQILNASITASWLIGAVVLVRLVIKRKAPRWIVCLLWGLVAVRLVLPFEVESSFSLVPETPKITLEVSEESVETSVEPECSLQAPPVEQLGNTSRPTEESTHDSAAEESVPEDHVSEESAPESSTPEESTEENVPETSIEESLEESVEESTEESFEESMDTSTETSTEISAEESVPTVVGSVTNPPSAGDSGISTATVAGIVWLCGLVALAVYALVNYLLLKKQVAIFVPDKRGFRRCEAIDTPFVLGFFRPRIYLPYGLSSANEPYILAHEQAHIRRLDHLVKPVAYLVLAIHWFNPLVWLSFVLFCKDIEYACDEKVLENAAADIRKDYAFALLECASKRSFLAASPIAFGEVSVKNRVKKTMSYKKPLLWVMALCIILCALVAVLFCTSPADTEDTSSQEQSTENVLETSSEEPSSSTEESDVSQLTGTDESRPEVSDDTSTEESQPEISDDPSDDVSQPEDEVPEEIVEPIYDEPTPVESTAELLFRFEIGPDGLFEYNSLFYDFADYANMTLPGNFLVDENMDFFILYYYGDNTLCLDGTDKSPKPLKSITSFLGDVNKSNSATRLFEKTSDGEFVLHKTYGSVEFASENAFIILRQIPDSRKIYMEKQEVYQYEYYVYDGQGTPLHRVMLTEARAMVPSPCAIPFTCHSHKDKEIHTSLRYRPYTVQINNLTWEGLLDYEVLWMDESTCYLVACFPNHGEVHKITLGSTNQERIPQTEENSKKPKLEEVFALQLVQRDELNAFLQDPQNFVFNHTDKKDEDDIPAFITMVYERFYLREDFLELYNNRSVMEAYLAQQGVTCTVSKVYAFDSPALPITLYVQTQEGNDYFITAEDNRNSYTYTFYTETEFCSIFMRKEGKVVLNGQTLELSHAPVFYSTYVDVPVIALLKAMGTTMNELSDDSIIGTLGSQECFIDLDCATVSYGLYSFPSTSESYGYLVDKELMLRNDYYSDFLRYFCPGAEILIDLETNTVYITK